MELVSVTTVSSGALTGAAREAVIVLVSDSSRKKGCWFQRNHESASRYLGSNLVEGSEASGHGCNYQPCQPTTSVATQGEYAVIINTEVIVS